MFSRIANPPRMLASIPNTAIAIIMNPSGQNAIDRASRTNTKMFVAYIGVLIFTALLVALFTYLTWKASNGVQDAIVADSNARIAEADQKGQEAGRKAGEANKRAQELEKANLTLRGQVATLETNAVDAQKDMASLQKAASDAKATQQRVELDLAKQQERAAIAEKDLGQLKLEREPRRLTQGQKALLLSLLRGEPMGEVDVSCVMGDGEGNAFATDISGVLHEAGWNKLPGSGQAAYVGGDPIGLAVLVHSPQNVPARAVRLQQVFFAAGIPLSGIADAKIPEGSVTIIVGHKPPVPIQ